jgi:hypothetical protein
MRRQRGKVCHGPEHLHDERTACRARAEQFSVEAAADAYLIRVAQGALPRFAAAAPSVARKPRPPARE